VELAYIPEEMQRARRWVGWRYEQRPDPETGELKWTKVPYQVAHPKYKASSTNPKTWGTFAQAEAAYAHGELDGIGFALGDGWAGVDLDHCCDPESGSIHEWALREIRAIGSYSERSPSGEGVHILLYGNVLGGRHGRRSGGIEAYSAKRFFTVSGHHLPQTPPTVEKRQEALDDFCRRHFPQESKKRSDRQRERPHEPLGMDDEALIAKAVSANDGGKFARLWEGDTSGYKSHSEAVAALLLKLAFWTREDAPRMDRLFRRAGLMCAKWEEKRGDSTWGECEIDHAIDFNTQVHEPGHEPIRYGEPAPALVLYTARVEPFAGNGHAAPDVAEDYDHDPDDSEPDDQESGDAEEEPEEARAVDSSAQEPQSGGSGAEVAAPAGKARPIIMTTGVPLRTKIRQSERALAAANDPPQLFVRGGLLSRFRRNERGEPVIEVLGDAALRVHLTESADFMRSSGKAPVHVDPPIEVSKTLLAKGTWSRAFPALVGIVEVPVLRPGGTELHTPGYDAPTALIYEPAMGLQVPDIPDQPSQEQVRTAAQFILDEVLVDFPFQGDADRAHAMAAILTPIVRPAIRGCVPLILLDAPRAGTGKTLIAGVVAIGATGRSAEIMTAPAHDEAEWRKRLTSVLRENSNGVILIDNLPDVLRSAQLAAVLTAETWRDRVLGLSQTLVLPQRATWLATGNNIKLGGDLPRRCVRVRMDARMARPWERRGEQFRHPHLLAWVRAHRGEVLAALLTVARGWYVAGEPVPADAPTLGSFEDWARVMGGMLSYAGIEGFLSNLADLYVEADEETPEWETFLAALRSVFGERAVSVAEMASELDKEMKEEIDTRRVLLPALPERLADAFTRRRVTFGHQLGRALGQHEGTRYTVGDDDLYVTRDCLTARKGGVLWRASAEPVRQSPGTRGEEVA
jgi:hypothetical protein